MALSYVLDIKILNELFSLAERTSKSKVNDSKLEYFFLVVEEIILTFILGMAARKLIKSMGLAPVILTLKGVNSKRIWEMRPACKVLVHTAKHS